MVRRRPRARHPGCVALRPLADCPWSARAATGQFDREQRRPRGAGGIHSVPALTDRPPARADLDLGLGGPAARSAYALTALLRRRISRIDSTVHRRWWQGLLRGR